MGDVGIHHAGDNVVYPLQLNGVVPDSVGHPAGPVAVAVRLVAVGPADAVDLAGDNGLDAASAPSFRAHGTMRPSAP